HGNARRSLRRRRAIQIAVGIALSSTSALSLPRGGQPIPSPWADQDIGAPAIAGSASYDPVLDAFTITAAGADIGGTSDQFHFVYQQVSGDVDVIARVDALVATSASAK